MACIRDMYQKKLYEAFINKTPFDEFLVGCLEKYPLFKGNKTQTLADMFISVYSLEELLPFAEKVGELKGDDIFEILSYFPINLKAHPFIVHACPVSKNMIGLIRLCLPEPIPFEHIISNLSSFHNMYSSFVKVVYCHRAGRIKIDLDFIMTAYFGTVETLYTDTENSICMLRYIIKELSISDHELEQSINRTIVSNFGKYFIADKNAKEKTPAILGYHFYKRIPDSNIRRMICVFIFNQKTNWPSSIWCNIASYFLEAGVDQLKLADRICQRKAVKSIKALMSSERVSDKYTVFIERINQALCNI